MLLYPDQNNKRIVLALQSGLKSELIWALNTLTLLSFKEKDDMRKDACLAKIPGLLDALLQIVCQFMPLVFLLLAFILLASCFWKMVKMIVLWSR